MDASRLVRAVAHRSDLFWAILAIPFLLILASDLAALAARWAEAGPGFGADYRLYMAASARWLAGGPFYEPYQVAGPYQVIAPAILYPPTALVLFAPFTGLPAALWWAIPLSVTAWIMWAHHPRPVSWPVMALCLAVPTTAEVVYAGNPVLWVVAAVALGTRYGWPAVAVLLKPTLAPFALWGVHRRSWWLALATGAAMSLLFLSMWPDYLAVLKNARDPNGIAYSLNQVPTMLLPIVAWIGGRTGRRVTPPASL